MKIVIHTVIVSCLSTESNEITLLQDLEENFPRFYVYSDIARWFKPHASVLPVTEELKLEPIIPKKYF